MVAHLTEYEGALMVLQSWGCSSREISQILPDFDSDEIRYKKSICIFRMEQLLVCIFENDWNRKNFMRLKNNNEFFDGQSPVEILCECSPDVDVFIQVVKRLDALARWG